MEYKRKCCMKSEVDTRELKNGQIRLRFRLSDYAFQVINQAIKSTNVNGDTASLQLICRDYLSGKKDKTQASAVGSNRLLFRLCPEQFEVVRIALDLAKEVGSSDESAMLNIGHSRLKILNRML